MKQNCLEEIVTFTLGKNITRIKNQDDELYTPDDFEKDLHNINEIDCRAGCIINLIKSKAAPISVQSQKKCITSNFLTCTFDTNVLDPWYFCYQFNEGKSIEQQIAMFHQGITLSVKRLNINTIGSLKINLIDIEKQRLVGSMYRQSIIQKDLMIQQAENYNKLIIETIRKIEEA